MAEHFSNLARDLDFQLHEARKSQNINTKQSSPRNILIKLCKTKMRREFLKQ